MTVRTRVCSDSAAAPPRCLRAHGQAYTQRPPFSHEIVVANMERNLRFFWTQSWTHKKSELIMFISTQVSLQGKPLYCPGGWIRKEWGRVRKRKEGGEVKTVDRRTKKKKKKKEALWPNFGRAWAVGKDVSWDVYMWLRVFVSPCQDLTTCLLPPLEPLDKKQLRIC